MTTKSDNTKRQFEKVLTILKRGSDTKVATILKNLNGQIVPARLSVYMWEIRKAGGKLEATRDGKKIVSYRLTNAEAFKAPKVAPAPIAEVAQAA